MARPDSFLPRQVRARPLAVFASAFLLGLIAAKARPMPILACAAGLGGAALLCVLARRKRRVFALCLLLAGLAAGMCRMTLALDAIPTVESQYSVQMTGRVVSEPFRNPDTGRLIARFQLETLDGEPSDLRVRLYLRDEEPVPEDAVAYGQRLSLTGHLWRADPVTNPYEFDFEDYLRRQGLSAYATAKLGDVTVLESRRDARSALIDARRAIAARIDALFPENAPLVRALVLGDRSLLDEEFRESLSRTGTAHLISISGLHVTVLAALLALFLRLFLPRNKANLAAVLLLIPYGALIGFNAPFVRALIMFALVCLAPVAGHPSDSVTRLAAAMLAYLLVKPLAIGDAGFALSFAASAGLILLSPPLNRLIGIESLQHRRYLGPPRKRLLRQAVYYFASLLSASLAAQLATLPIVVACFGVQSVISLPFNLLCVPLCMLGYVLSVIVLLVSLVSVPLAALLAKGPDGLFTLLTAATRLSFRLPFSGVRFGRYPAALVALHWAVLLAASDLSLIRPRIHSALPLALLAVAGLSALITFARAFPFSVTFMDAGQADCAVVRTRGHTYMFDAGDTYTPAADYLNATALGVDAVFLSHPHQDHAGGLTDVLTSFRPGTIYVPAGWFAPEDTSPAVTGAMDLAQDMGVPIVELCAGDVVELPGGATVEIFSPEKDAPTGEVNDMSMLALLTCQEQSVLFTGDLSADGEPARIPDADILKVAHHGSAKATSERFLDACSPEFAVISVGENSFGHPADETLQKLDAVGATTLLTRDCGAITLTWRGSWQIDTYLEAANDLE